MSVISASMLLGCTPMDIPNEQPKQDIENPAGGNDDSQNDDTPKEEIMMKMTVGDYVFEVEYAENNTAEAFKKMMPVTLQMEELNGNEKYCYIDGSLPTAASNPGTINAGDIMLFGSNCVVVFYETFKTSYSYTRIGKVKDVANLKTALGAGNVNVRFEFWIP